MKNISILFLAVVMFALNIGLTLNTHYCGGEIAETSLSLGVGDVGCGMENVASACKKDVEGEVLETNCCDDQLTQFSMDTDYSKSSIESANVDIQLIAFVTAVFNLYSFETTTQPEYLNYSPPILEKDILIFNQTFLI